MTLGQKIRARREELGLTLTEVAARVGVGVSTVRKWETGAIENIRQPKIMKLAEALSVPPIHFINWYDDKTESSNAKNLTLRDQKDVAQTLNNFMLELEQSDSLMFDGNSMSEEAKDSIISAMRIGLELAKTKNKARFTPKKSGDS